MKKITLCGFVFGWLLTYTMGGAFADEFVEGKDYQLVETEVLEELSEDDDETSEDNIIEVLEFFNYGCPHCYRLESIINDWLENKEDDVEFVRVAVPLRRDWIPLARVYYVAEEFDLIDKVHPVMFKGIFEHDLQMHREKILEELFDQLDVPVEDFQKVYTSKEVADALRSSTTQMRLFGLKGTPAIVIANKYVIDTEMADGLERMFEIVEFLIEKIRNDQKKST